MKHKKRIHTLFIFGTRPEAIKLAPVIVRLQSDPHLFQTTVAVTAQHREMLDQVLDVMQIRPDIDLGLMRPQQSLAELTSAAALGLETVVRRVQPDLVMVQGDTATTFMGALVAFYHHLPLAHVEAGLRTFDLDHPFPEEAYRRMISLLAQWHFAPTALARRNLLAEGIPRQRIFLTGNPVVEAMRSVLQPLRPLQQMGFRFNPGIKRHVVVTAHRRENFGPPLRELCLALRQLARDFPEVAFIFPVHRNPIVRRTVASLLPRPAKNLLLIKPLPYQTFVNLMARAALVLSDSGGIQEEAPALGVPVLVLRQVTERPEALTAGACLVAPQQSVIRRLTTEVLRQGVHQPLPARCPFGDGRAAERIAQAIAWIFRQRQQRPRSFRG